MSDYWNVNINSKAFKMLQGAIKANLYNNNTKVIKNTEILHYEVAELRHERFYETSVTIDSVCKQK